MCELYTITEKGHQWLELPHELVHIKTTMKTPSGQNYDNKMALQVNNNPTAANIMDLLQIFVINKQYHFQRVIFSNMTYFCINYTNTFFIHTMNYFSVVLRIMFLMCMEN